jgi:hypothetical protein
MSRLGRVELELSSNDVREDAHPSAHDGASQTQNGEGVEVSLMPESQ